MKKAISIFLAAMMLLSLAACGGGSGGDSSGGGSGGGSSNADDGHTLSIQAWDASFNIPAIQAAADDYKANVDPDFKLEITEMQSGDIETNVTNASQSGNYSVLPDIILFQDHRIQSFVTNYPDAFIAVEGADINWSDFGAEKLSYSTIDGTHYGVPVDNGTVIAAYRIDLLEQAGHTIDELTDCTWDTFLDIGEDVYNATGKYMLCMNNDGNDLPYLMLQAEGASQWKDGEPYLSENPDFVKCIEILKEAYDRHVLYLPNGWNGYTDESIQGDMLAGVMNGNWIIPTMQLVSANSGKWEITNMPTVNGGGGYAANGGSSLYITANCRNVDLAKDFLAKTFGGSTVTYDAALTNGGVISCYAPAGESAVYSEGVAFFNDTPIYADIVEMGTHVPVIEQNDYHYDLRGFVGTAIININDGADITTEIANAEQQMRFQMGLQ